MSLYEIRALRLGLGGEATRRYTDEWVVSITDVPELAKRVHSLVREGDQAAARELLPVEEPYPAALGHLVPGQA